MKREEGKYYTVKNPFEDELFIKWLKNAKQNSNNKIILEPFAGSGNIPKMFKNEKFECYDIDEFENSSRRDTISDFPDGFDIAITNPPYLEKSSAKRYNINFREDAANFRNIYLHCIDIMLKKCKYVAVIVPASFKLRYKKYKKRLYAIIEMQEILFEDTKQDVVLVLFNSENEITDPIFKNGKNQKKISTIEKKWLEISVDKKYKITFNSNDGNIGMHAFGSKKNLPKFVASETIKEKMKISTRNRTKILVENFSFTSEDIENLNFILNKFRKETLDLFTSSFYWNKSKRVRINYKIIKYILEVYINEHTRY